jgi:non-canonical poly(A) RNA polymerase PAPD5/7
MTKTTITSQSKDGFNGEDFVGFGRLGDSKDRDPGPSTSRGRKRTASEMLAPQEQYSDKKQETEAKSRHSPWVASVDWDKCTNPAQMLHEEIKAFVDYVTPTPEEHEMRTLVVECIRRTVVSQWPGSKVSPFGSFETGLYLPQGDIDLILQNEHLLEAPRTTLHRLASLFRHYNIGTNIQVIAKAKVPIIKFVSTYGNFPVDISINQVNGLAAGRIVNNFIKHMPALRPLALVVKMFLQQRGMNEVYTGGLGSYSLVIMVASFLKMHPKIRRGEIDPMRNLGVLLVEFFELYGHYFNYDETGISLRDGGCYFSKAERGWLVPNQPFLLCIEDPQDRSNDVSKGTHGITRVRQTLAGAYEILVTTLQQRASILEAKRHGRHVSLTKDPNSAALSILSSITGIPPSVIKHRKAVSELHSSGALHYLMGVSTAVKVEVDAKDPSITTKQPKEELSLSSSESAWEEASKGAEETVRSKRQRREHSEDEGRYGIQHRSQKIKIEQGVEVIYVDSDSEDGQVEDGEEYSWGSWRPDDGMIPPELSQQSSSSQNSSRKSRNRH